MCVQGRDRKIKREIVKERSKIEEKKKTRVKKQRMRYSLQVHVCICDLVCCSQSQVSHQMGCVASLHRNDRELTVSVCRPSCLLTTTYD